MYLAGSDVPCYNVTVPGIEKASNGTEVNVTQKILIENKDEFVQYALQQVLSKNFTVYLVGQKPTLQLGGLPKIHVDFNHSMTIDGKYHFRIHHTKC